jgi:hypothetical protein
MMRGGIAIVNEMEFRMCKRTERLSPRSYGRAVKRFLLAKSMSSFDSNFIERVITAKQTNFFHDSKNETIVVRWSKYSDSHFIDCNPIARRLSASLTGLLFS